MSWADLDNLKLPPEGEMNQSSPLVWFIGAFLGWKFRICWGQSSSRMDSEPLLNFAFSVLNNSINKGFESISLQLC